MPLEKILRLVLAQNKNNLPEHHESAPAPATGVRF